VAPTAVLVQRLFARITSFVITAIVLIHCLIPIRLGCASRL
jgi:hypothetical protein